ncbi:helix-turn-helix domain-containing protein [Halomicrobium mukohataei]|uniref:Bacterio-opsin activator HTH domain protein n=2 Tax=Halomicrobium mukohataei TaxID=57705 RepID=C7P4X1_HALMD|nr:helix-turn-helix domain-containing protein [Halomicrobium mukohataei]ACV49366.1 Bacterio-opsin activator HTH domain protein [Halomicrobium mukohataei DSM 12286]QCD67199.1 bacterio-opsin activator [Halomicrobium mukohataei]
MQGSTTKQGDDGRDLYVAFEIKPVLDSDCPLDEFEDADGDVVEVRQQLLHDQCQTEMTIQSEETPVSPGCEEADIVHSASEVDGACFCAVFGAFDCIPEIVDVTEESVCVETYLPDRNRLTELVESLRDVTRELHLRQLKRIDAGTGETGGQTITLALDDVTEKQREAVTRAVAAGYYATPRETSLEALADDLGISKSACSQRLNAVESTLAVSAFANATTSR